MRTFYLPALGYSDTATHRWLTIRLYERVDGVYVHGGNRHYGTYRRSQLHRLDGEVMPHKFALLNLTATIDGEVLLVIACPLCGVVQEHHIERAIYAIQCPGCRELWEIEELLAHGAVEGSIGEIDNRLSARMIQLAAWQGYSVRASD